MEQKPAGGTVLTAGGVRSHSLSLTLFFLSLIFSHTLNCRSIASLPFPAFVLRLSSPRLSVLPSLYLRGHSIVLRRRAGGRAKAPPGPQRQRAQIMMEEWFKLPISEETVRPPRRHKGGRLHGRSLGTIGNISAEVARRLSFSVETSRKGQV